LHYIDTQPRGDLLSRVTNDIDNVAQSLQQTLSQMLTSVLLLVGVAILMFTISPLLAVVALTTVPVSVWGMRAVAKRARPKFIAQWKHTGALNAQIEETFTGHAIVKSFGRQREVEQQFRDTNDELYEASFGAQFMSSLMQPWTMFLGNIQYVIVAVVGGLRVASGAISVGDIQAFIQYVNQFNQPIVQIANSASILQSTAAAAERVFEFLAEEEEIPNKESVASPSSGTVEFDHVHFGYEPDKVVIEDFTASAAPGQRVAIVGPTGAGKTTMVNLLMRFYDVNSGSIRIDGIDTRTMSRHDVRAMFGMVLQDTWLFNGTIRDNLAYGKPEATEAEIVEAAKAAHADHFIRALPKGYDMVLDEEASNISQGEKQLLTIARAMLVKTPMLILDEATSSVDTRTEVLIQQAMDRLMKGKTAFIIAHRLSTIRNADLILVMREGNIVEHGTHEELLQKNGFYADLYNSQFLAPAV
jgi:ATP-binding cassette subfamily B protein